MLVLAPASIVGKGYTPTVILSLAEQPFPSVPTSV